MKIAVASGKGGTGKTTVAVNLARVIDLPVQLLDCDVEEPNAHLFLQKTHTIQEETVSIPVPRVVELLCDGCGECSRFCEYRAIVSLGTKPLVFQEMCHGCGGCAKVCPKKAIYESECRIGVIKTDQMEHITLIQGCLDVGVPMAPPVIRAVKTRQRKDGFVILDAPPGTSCPVITTISGADFVLLVTEPTPFGLHDLTLAVDMVRELNVPFGIVINRMGVGDDRVHSFCRDENIAILLEIPDDRKIAEAYSRGELIADTLPAYCSLFRKLFENVVAYFEKNNCGAVG